MPSLCALVIAALVGLFLGGIIRSLIYEIKGNKSEMHANGCVAVIAFGALLAVLAWWP